MDSKPDKKPQAMESLRMKMAQEEASGEPTSAQKAKSKDTETTSGTLVPSDSDGGAPLHSASKATPSTQHTSKPSDPSDDEMALVRASTAFEDLNKTNDPFSQAGPQVPRSVAPTNTPQRHRHVHYQPSNRNQNAGSYRDRSSSQDSYGSGWNSGGSGSGYGFRQTPEPLLQEVNSINQHLAVVKNFINMTPGVAANVAQRHQAMIVDVTSMINNWARSAIRERNEATRAKNQEAEKLKQALEDETKSKKEIEKLQSELKHATEHEKLLNERIEIYKEQAKMLKEKITSLEEESARFEQHHQKLCKKFENQDVDHYKSIRILEEEIQALRQQNEALTRNSSSGAVSQALIRISEANLAPSLPGSVLSLEEHDDAESRITDSIIFKGKTPLRKAFKPNPQAPAWTPSKDHDGSKKDSPSAIPGTVKTPGGGGAPLYPRGDEASSADKKQSEPFPSPANKGPSPANKGTPIGGMYPFPRLPDVIETPSGRDITHPPQPDPEIKPGTAFQLVPEDGVGNPHKLADWGQDDVRYGIDHFYEVCKGVIVSLFKLGIPFIPDNMLWVQEPTTWLYLIDLVYPNKPEAVAHMKYLLSVPAYRPYILQRVLLDYIFKKMITPGIFLGFTAEMDRHLTALQEQIVSFASANQRSSSRSRQRVIEEHARLVKAILTHPDARKFRDETVDHHAGMLAQITKPMRNSTIDDEAAMKTMRILVRGAWNLSTKIWSSNMTLHYYFPDCGSKFAMATMDAVNQRHLATNPEQLQFSQYRISLVVAPTLTLRDDREARMLRTFGIRKAEVLVMK